MRTSGLCVVVNLFHRIYYEFQSVVIMLSVQYAIHVKNHTFRVLDEIDSETLQ